MVWSFYSDSMFCILSVILIRLIVQNASWLISMTHCLSLNSSEPLDINSMLLFVPNFFNLLWFFWSSILLCLSSFVLRVLTQWRALWLVSLMINDYMRGKGAHHQINSNLQFECYKDIINFHHQNSYWNHLGLYHSILQHSSKYYLSGSSLCLFWYLLAVHMYATIPMRPTMILMS